MSKIEQRCSKVAYSDDRLALLYKIMRNLGLPTEELLSCMQQIVMMIQDN